MKTVSNFYDICTKMTPWTYFLGWVCWFVVLIIVNKHLSICLPAFQVNNKSSLIARKWYCVQAMNGNSISCVGWGVEYTTFFKETFIFCLFFWVILYYWLFYQLVMNLSKGLMTDIENITWCSWVDFSTTIFFLFLNCNNYKQLLEM